MAKEKAADLAAGMARVKILHDTFVQAEKGGHQKVLAGAIVTIPESDASHLVLNGKAEAA